jgi:hypothetical protein
MSNGHGERLSRKQEVAIVALLEQDTVEKAAQAVGVNEKTLRNWQKRPDFVAAFRAARRNIVEGAITRLQQLATGAILALNRNLTCRIPAVEVRTAQIVLEQSLRALELGDVLERVEELERRIGGDGTRRTGFRGAMP